MSKRVSNGVVAEEQVVADIVVGVREEVGADGGGDDFAAIVVGECRINGRDARYPSSTSGWTRERVKGIEVGVDKGRIEVGGAIRHETAAVIIAVDDAADRVARRRCNRVTLVITSIVRVGDGEGTASSVRGGDARKVAVVIVGVADAAFGFVVDSESIADRTVEGIV